MKNLKQVILSLIVLFTILFGSCKKEPLNPTLTQKEDIASMASKSSSDVFHCGEATVANLLAGQNINVGTVTVYNDVSYLYVTYNTTSNWFLNELHLYVGDLSGVPKTKTGNPIPGKFPYAASLASNAHEYTFKIPLSTLGDCFIVAAHAVVVQRNPDCSVMSTETAWGNGTRFVLQGNWGTYFNVCKAVCANDGDQNGCSMSQGYWFASPVSVWPSSGLKVGGFTYTKEEALAIWNTSNAGGIHDSKKGFLQVATIYLSGSTVAPTATVWADVANVETWLSKLDKLSAEYLPTGNSSVGSAAGRIGDWVDAHHCQ